MAFLHFWVGIIYWYDTMGYDITAKERDLGNEKVAEKNYLHIFFYNNELYCHPGEFTITYHTYLIKGGEVGGEVSYFDLAYLYFWHLEAGLR